MTIQLFSHRSVLSIIFLVYVFVISAGAQDQENKTYLRATFELPIYLFGNYPNTKNNGSYIGGLEIRYELTNKMTISSGIGYESKHFLIEYSENAPFISSERFKISYLNIPVRPEFQIIQINSHNLGFIFGLDVGILLDANRFVVYKTDRQVNDIGDYNFKNLIFSGTLGLQHNYTLSERITVSASIRYRRNLMTNQGINGDSGQGTSNAICVAAGMGFRLK